MVNVLSVQRGLSVFSPCPSRNKISSLIKGKRPKRPRPTTFGVFPSTNFAALLLREREKSFYPSMKNLPSTAIQYNPFSDLELAEGSNSGS